MGIETLLFKTLEKKTAREISQALRQIADDIEAVAEMSQQGEEEITLEIQVEEEQDVELEKFFEIELEWDKETRGSGGFSALY